LQKGWRRHKPGFAAAIDLDRYTKKDAKANKTLLEIVDEIYHDKVFDNVVNFKSFPKSDAVLNSKEAPGPIRDYVMKWDFDESPEGIAKAWTQLFEMVTHFLASAAFPPPEAREKYKGKLHPILDFFLMYETSMT
jgi:hypothetical protein